MEIFKRAFQIPTNHPSGTFWYHPHLHGLVAEQLFGSLAGLFVVQGEIDEITEIKAAQEKFLVLQDFAINNGGRRLSSAHMSLMMGRYSASFKKRGETIRIPIPFRDFAGKTVYHCHILDHEDLGMMGNLLINESVSDI